MLALKQNHLDTNWFSVIYLIVTPYFNTSLESLIETPLKQKALF